MFRGMTGHHIISSLKSNYTFIFLSKGRKDGFGLKNLNVNLTFVV